MLRTKYTIKAILLVLAAGLFVTTGLAQKATIKEERMVFKTYMFSDPNPVPDMEKNYPYFKFDGFTNKAIQREWNMVIMENDYIKVYVNTDIGGKIWGAIEKSTGKEFLYYNDVVKFRDVAHRGAWTSGGIEFNFGIMSHAATSATPQDYVIRENLDGSVSCVIGAIDLHTGTKWNVDIRLPADRAYVETCAFWANTNNIPVSSYHYSNAAAKAAGNLEFLYPGNLYIGHEGEVGDWPVENGRQISFYEKNNFGSYKSYHVINGYAGYMGGYWHEDDFGFGNLRDYDDMPGKKIWIWGLADEGMIWEGLLTDTKGQYIEFQTGNLFNQAMPGSSLTPFKHREFIPYDTERANEKWFPLKGTGGMVAASEYAVLNVVRHSGDVEIRLSALAPVDARLTVTTGGHTVLNKSVKLKPLELTMAKVGLSDTADFTVELGNGLLYYSSAEKDVITNRPAYPNKEFDWHSASGLYTKGLELEKLQSYIDGGYPNKKAHDLYRQSLAKDPAFAPALNRIAFSFYRRMQYDSALKYTLKSLAIDTYDPEANYLFGIVSEKLHQQANARSGFAIAAKSTAYRVAGYTGLAKTYLREGRYREALKYAGKALDFNQYNIVALEVQAIALRLSGHADRAAGVWQQIYRLDATSAFVAYERAGSRSEKKTALVKLITNELAAESYIQLAVRYRDYGQWADALQVLEMAPPHPIVWVLLAAWDKTNRNTWLARAVTASPELVFPFRSETYEALGQLMNESDSWKLKYYTALVLWEKDRCAEARELIQACGSLPDFAPFYLARAKLFESDTALVLLSLNKARELAPESWRVSLALIDYNMGLGNYLQAAKIARGAYGENPERSILGLRYANALLRNKDYRKAIAFLDKLVVIPFEGAVEGRQIYHETLLRAAYTAIVKKKYKEAARYAEKAKLWPESLGTGKPYNADERLENAILAFCHQQMNEAQKAKRFQKMLLDYRVKDGQKEGPMLYLQLKLLKDSGQPEKAAGRLARALAAEPDNKYLLWLRQMERGKEISKNQATLLKQEAEAAPLDNPYLLLYGYLEVTR